MTRWLISAPAWGEACVDVFCAAALPALERAVRGLVSGDWGRPFCEAIVVVHTDQPERVAAAATQITVEPRPVPAGLRDFDCLSQAHREVLSMACRGDVVVLLTADLVVSERGLAYCARALDNPQKLLVACAGVRAVRGGPLPDTSDAAGLMAWAWRNRHPMTEACRWPAGDSADLSRTYFEREGTVTARLALPHPLAVRIDGRPLRFSPTVDANLIQCFRASEIHLTTDSDELALVELSPREKDYGRVPRTFEQRLAEYEVRIADPLQRWCLAYRVRLVGAGETDDGMVVERILSLGGTK